MSQRTFEPPPAAQGALDASIMGRASATMGRRRPLISLVIPAYNEEGNVARLEQEVCKVAQSLPSYDFEFIVIDNSSTDRTGPLVKQICKNDDRWKYIRFSRNFLVESSISAGYRHAKGDAMIVLYSDLQEPPELIPTMLEKWSQGYDVVYGVHQKREGESKHLTILVKIAYRMVRWLSDVKIPADSGDFRLISSRVRDALEQCGEYHRYTRGLIAWLGFSQIGIPYVRQPRRVGVSKSPFSVYMAYFVNAITTFSLKPLQLFFFIGLALIALSVLGLVGSIAAWKAMGEFAPCAFNASLLMLFSGINSVGLGVLGEYIGRTYTEVRGRPRYIIQETANIESVIAAQQNALQLVGAGK